MERAGTERTGAEHNRTTRLEWTMLAAILAAVALLVPEALRARLWISGLPGPGLYPTMLLGLIAAVGGVLLCASFLTRRGAVKAAHEPKASPRDRAWLRPLGVGLSLLLFPLVMPFLGFRVVSFVYAMALALVLSPVRDLRRVAMIVGFAAVLAVGLHFLFARVFNVVLPVGSLSGL